MHRALQVLRVGARIAAGLVIGLATWIVTATSNPNTTFAGSRAIYLASAAAISVAAGLPVVRAGVRAARADGLLDRQAIQEVLRATLVHVVKELEVTLPADKKRGIWTQVGVHAFVVSRGLPVVWRPYLRRVGRARLSSVPPPSSIRWTKGKGVVGMCWERCELVGEELSEALAAMYDEGKEAWDALDRESRLGLSYEELRRSRGYGAVVAAPMLDAKGKFRGCVSVDVPSGVHHVDLWTEPILRAIQNAAATLIQMGPPWWKD